VADEVLDLDDHRPELAFDFALGWPDDVTDNVRTLFSFDLEQVEGRDRLGTLHFNTAPNVITAIRRIARDLAEEPWDELPSAITDGHLLAQLQTLNDVVQRMTALSAGSARPPTSSVSMRSTIGFGPPFVHKQLRPA